MRQIVLTPVEIEFLIHCHIFPQTHSRIDTGSVQTGIAKMLQEDLIQQEDGRTDLYELTERGLALMEVYTSTPLPVSVEHWVDADDNVLLA